MALRGIPYRPGVVTDDTALAAEGYAVSSDKIRYVNSRVQSLGGWSRLTLDVIPGVPRALLPYVTNSGVAQMLVGSSCKELVYRSSRLYNITPARISGNFSTSSFATTSGSTTVTVNQTAHGAMMGDTVYISNATSVGGIVIGGTSGTLTNAFSTVSGSRVIAVTQSGHNLPMWSQATFSGASAIAGITIAGVYVVYPISTTQYLLEATISANATVSAGGGTPTYWYGFPYTVTGSVSANSYQITVSSAATSTTSGSGAASYLYEINCGRINTTAGQGYGTNQYGVGPYGASVPSTTPNQARTIAQDAYGEIGMFNNLGGPIYEFNNVFSQRGVPVTNAPARCNWMLATAERALMAFGCTDSSGIFDPMLIRWSDLTDRTIWTPANSNTAGDTRLGLGSFIVAARHTRDGILVWTDLALYFIRYTGDVDNLYDATPVGTNCGLVGPMAAIEQDGLAYWITPQLAFYTFNGGTPRAMPCPVREVAFADIIDQLQVWKCVGSYDSSYTAFYFFFPTPATQEIARYVRCDLIEAANDPRSGWSIGTFDRTAWIDDNVLHGSSPVAASSSGILYSQETGLGDDGAPITRYVEWAPIDLSKDGVDGDHVLNMRRVVMDARIDSGTLAVTLKFRRWPQGPLVTKGPYTFSGGTQYIDVRGQGRQVGALIQSAGATDDWRLGEIRLDISEGPLR